MKRSALLCLAAVILFTGCVSTKVYDQAISESLARQTKLTATEQERETLRKEIEGLKKDIEELKAEKEKESADYEGRINDLMDKGITTTREIEEIRNERKRLSETNAAMASKMASLAEANAAMSSKMASLGGELAEKTELVDQLRLKTGELSAQKEQEIAEVKNTYETLVSEMGREIEQGQIKITQAADRLSVSMVEQILFDSGKAEIKSKGLQVLKRVGDILKKVEGKQIRIEGHTDNVPIGGRLIKKYPTNWELSTARATNVVRYIQDKVGVDPALLSAAGMSQYQPVVSNDTPEGKARNRRIEIVLLPRNVDKVLEELKK